MAVCIDCFRQIRNDLRPASVLGARCVSCAGQAAARRPAEPAPIAVADGRASRDLGAALGYGVLGALAGGLLWYGAALETTAQVGVVAIAIGLVVGAGVSLGQRDRNRFRVQVLAFTLTLLALAITEYFVARHAHVEALANRALSPNVPVFLSPRDALTVVRDDISNDLWLLLFAAIALFEAVSIPAGHRPMWGRRVDQ